MAAEATVTIREPAHRLPVRDEVDVLLAGGGLGGIAAALAAVRSGARTLLVERNSFPGGTATAGMFRLMFRGCRRRCGVKEWCLRVVDW